MNHELVADRKNELLLDLFGILWRKRSLVFVGAVVGLSIGIITGALMPPMYRSEIVLEYVDRSGSNLSSGAGGLRDLAGLAGITLTQASGRSYAIGRLKSNELLTGYISVSKAYAHLFADKWDQSKQRPMVRPNTRVPTLQDSVNKFRKDVFSVNEDKLTQLITLSFRWTNAKVAHNWASEYSDYVDSMLKQGAIIEADRNIAFLEREIKQAQLPEIKMGLVRMMESQIGNKMNARSASAYAFRIVDPPVLQERPFSPNKLLLAIAGVLAGALLMSIMVILASAIPAKKSR
jgi:uncharacterized protein involved in exopolysaccharide biosynthesis